MAEAGNIAYDLNTFAPRPRRRRQPLHVVSNPQPKKLFGKVDLSAAKVVVAAAVFIALMFSVLAAQTRATELTSEIKTQQDALAELQDDYDYLSTQIEMKTNISAVEEYAATLGLAKMDQSQVYYVYGEDQDAVVRSKTGLGKFADTVAKGFMSMMEYFTS